MSKALFVCRIQNDLDGAWAEALAKALTLDAKADVSAHVSGLLCRGPALSATTHAPIALAIRPGASPVVGRSYIRLNRVRKTDEGSTAILRSAKLAILN
jgi:hypothetical protein